MTTIYLLYKYFVEHDLLSVAYLFYMTIVKLALFPSSGESSIIKSSRLDPLDAMTKDQRGLMDPT
jgi:hypothetical protein